jgi:sulfate adenylyltransferase subunit 1
MSTTDTVWAEPIAATASLSTHGAQASTASALRFITCGSVDDGKSTLIGRLLVDTRAVLRDHLAGVQRNGQVELALLTDGLSAEREQGITIDVAWRYFSTEQRKFIIGDTPGHEQYTRNMVTAASAADAALVLVDATKLAWREPDLALLPQTRRHSLLLKLLRVPSIIFAINKLDAIPQPALAYAHIAAALQSFARQAGVQVQAIVPVSALLGHNVVERAERGWCGYSGASLLEILEGLPTLAPDTTQPAALPVQWVEKFPSSSDTQQGRRIFWGRLATGGLRAGDRVSVFPSGQTATVAQVLDHVRRPGSVQAGRSAGVVLDRELDVSRGDWLLAEGAVAGASRELQATVAWLDDEPLQVGRVYWALHGHRWVKARVRRVLHRLDIHTLARQEAGALEANAIGQVELALQEPLPLAPFEQARVLGSLILVDMASHKTAAAVLVQ